MNDEREHIDRDIVRARELGWRVMDIGYVTFDQRYSADFWDAFDGDEPLALRVFYKMRPGAEVYVFDEAVLSWLRTQKRQPVKTTDHLWELAETYAPKGEE